MPPNLSNLPGKPNLSSNPSDPPNIPPIENDSPIGLLCTSTIPCLRFFLVIIHSGSAPSAAFKNTGDLISLVLSTLAPLSKKTPSSCCFLDNNGLPGSTWSLRYTSLYLGVTKFLIAVNAEPSLLFPVLGSFSSCDGCDHGIPNKCPIPLAVPPIALPIAGNAPLAKLPNPRAAPLK